MQSLVSLLWGIGTFAVSAFVMMMWVKLKRKQMGRPPVSEKMLRPPGESLRLRMEKMDEKFPQKLGVFLSINLLGGIFFHFAYTMRGQPLWIPITSSVLGAAVAFPSIPLLVNFVIKYVNHNLGFHGERVVGEHLNQLMLNGCQIFHDLEVDKKWNIDHIIVSPRGVFAVETKTRRKPDGENSHKLIFTGTDLQFPTRTDQHGIKQVADNARWLANFLTKTTGEHVEVAPILTFPGWWVERQGKNNVYVLNPKEIRSVVINECLPLLDESQRKRICFQLDQKCRDVDL